MILLKIAVVSALTATTVLSLWAIPALVRHREQPLVERGIEGHLKNRWTLQNGDVIFHTSQSAQSKAIQLATHSPYSHCGMIYQKDNEYFVFEAVQPVKLTPLKSWIARGQKGHYVIKRLKEADKLLTPQAMRKLKQAGEKYTGKPYDLYFEWTNERIYCSELIWKMYKEALGIELGKLQTLKEFDLSSPAVQQKLKERYGKQVPLEEKVISPESIFNSDQLVTVTENNNQQ